MKSLASDECVFYTSQSLTSKAAAIRIQNAKKSEQHLVKTPMKRIKDSIKSKTEKKNRRASTICLQRSETCN